MDSDNKLQLIPIKGKTLLPYNTISVDITSESSIEALSAVIQGRGREIIVSALKAVDKDTVYANDINEIGVLAKIVNVSNDKTNHIKVSLKGLYPIKITNFISMTPYFFVEYEKYETVNTFFPDISLYMKKINKMIDKLEQSDDEMPFLKISDIKNIEQYIYAIADYFTCINNQKLLDYNNLQDKMTEIVIGLEQELDLLKVDKVIGQKVTSALAKNQRDFFLREQLKAINEELNDDINEDDELEKKINSLKCSDEIRAKIMKEFKKMQSIPSASADSYVVRNYIEYLCELPWGIYTQDNLDIENARKVLDEDHYGLEKVKDRIIEFLAVRKLTGNNQGSILCLYGPPGVGKTSIGKSVARALNRNYERISLGGVRDEAEIRGHRRTYIGAMAGRIMNGVKHCKSSNPVFLLDEIDKMANDYKGDPQSALLEALDPAQNNTFVDHYVDLPYDLSQTLFITTANILDTIPRALLDRMELIEMNGYTVNEKIEIVKRHLLNKQKKENGIKCKVIIDDDTIEDIITYYTKESGVRELERQIGTILRKIAIKIVNEENEDNFEGEDGQKVRKPKKQRQITVNRNNIEDYLGIRKYTTNKKLVEPEVGAATGLAWTAFGGDTLTIEVCLFKGKGDIMLTGSLGDIMKESAKTAISFIRSHAKQYNIDENVFSSTDIHIHVPEGAVPKDGPSAGITIATAVLSALTKNTIRNDTAMTGEITLRGKVLPIGGLREKMLAAKRAGIKNIIIPTDNKKDVTEIPENVKENLNLIYASNVETVFTNSINGNL